MGQVEYIPKAFTRTARAGFYITSQIPTCPSETTCVREMTKRPSLGSKRIKKETHVRKAIWTLDTFSPNPVHKTMTIMIACLFVSYLF